MPVNVKPLFDKIMKDPDVIPAEGQEKKDLVMEMVLQRATQAANNEKALSMANFDNPVSKLLDFVTLQKADPAQGGRITPDGIKVFRDQGLNDQQIIEQMEFMTNHKHVHLEGEDFAPIPKGERVTLSAADAKEWKNKLDSVTAELSGGDTRKSTSYRPKGKGTGTAASAIKAAERKIGQFQNAFRGSTKEDMQRAYQEASELVRGNPEAHETHQENLLILQAIKNHTDEKGMTLTSIPAVPLPIHTTAEQRQRRQTNAVAARTQAKQKPTDQPKAKATSETPASTEDAPIKWTGGNKYNHALKNGSLVRNEKGDLFRVDRIHGRTIDLDGINEKGQSRGANSSITIDTEDKEGMDKYYPHKIGGIDNHQDLLRVNTQTRMPEGGDAPIDTGDTTEDVSSVNDDLTDDEMSDEEVGDASRDAEDDEEIDTEGEGIDAADVAANKEREEIAQANADRAKVAEAAKAKKAEDKAAKARGKEIAPESKARTKETNPMPLPVTRLFNETFTDKGFNALLQKLEQGNTHLFDPMAEPVSEGTGAKKVWWDHTGKSHKNKDDAPLGGYIGTKAEAEAYLGTLDNPEHPHHEHFNEIKNMDIFDRDGKSTGRKIGDHVGMIESKLAEAFKPTPPEPVAEPATDTPAVAEETPTPTATPTPEPATQTSPRRQGGRQRRTPPPPPEPAAAEEQRQADSDTPAATEEPTAEPVVEAKTFKGSPAARKVFMDHYGEGFNDALADGLLDPSEGSLRWSVADATAHVEKLNAKKGTGKGARKGRTGTGKGGEKAPQAQEEVPQAQEEVPPTDPPVSDREATQGRLFGGDEEEPVVEPPTTDPPAATVEEEVPEEESIDTAQASEEAAPEKPTIQSIAAKLGLPEDRLQELVTHHQQANDIVYPSEDAYLKHLDGLKDTNDFKAARKELQGIQNKKTAADKAAKLEAAAQTKKDEVEAAKQKVEKANDGEAISKLTEPLSADTTKGAATDRYREILEHEAEHSADISPATTKKLAAAKDNLRLDHKADFQRAENLAGDNATKTNNINDSDVSDEEKAAAHATQKKAHTDAIAQQHKEMRTEDSYHDHVSGEAGSAARKNAFDNSASNRRLHVDANGNVTHSEFSDSRLPGGSKKVAEKGDVAGKAVTANLDDHVEGERTTQTHHGWTQDAGREDHHGEAGQQEIAEYKALETAMKQAENDGDTKTAQEHQDAMQGMDDASGGRLGPLSETAQEEQRQDDCRPPGEPPAYFTAKVVWDCGSHHWIDPDKADSLQNSLGEGESHYISPQDFASHLGHDGYDISTPHADGSMGHQGGYLANTAGFTPVAAHSAGIPQNIPHTGKAGVKADGTLHTPHLAMVAASHGLTNSKHISQNPDGSTDWGESGPVPQGAMGKHLENDINNRASMQGGQRKLGPLVDPHQVQQKNAEKAKRELEARGQKTDATVKNATGRFRLLRDAAETAKKTGEKTLRGGTNALRRFHRSMAGEFGEKDVSWGEGLRMLGQDVKQLGQDVKTAAKETGYGQTIQRLQATGRQRKRQTVAAKRARKRSALESLKKPKEEQNERSPLPGQTSGEGMRTGGGDLIA